MHYSVEMPFRHLTWAHWVSLTPLFGFFIRTKYQVCHFANCNCDSYAKYRPTRQSSLRRLPLINQNCHFRQNYKRGTVMEVVFVVDVFINKPANQALTLPTQQCAATLSSHLYNMHFLYSFLLLLLLLLFLLLYSNNNYYYFFFFFLILASSFSSFNSSLFFFFLYLVRVDVPSPSKSSCISLKVFHINPPRSVIKPISSWPASFSDSVAHQRQSSINQSIN